MSPTEAVGFVSQLNLFTEAAEEGFQHGAGVVDHSYSFCDFRCEQISGVRRAAPATKFNPHGVIRSEERDHDKNIEPEPCHLGQYRLIQSSF